MAFRFKTGGWVVVSSLLLLSTAWSQQSAAAATQQDTFVIDEYRVLGNSVLRAEDVEQVLFPFLGRDKTIDDVELARQAVEKLYKDKGFGTVYVDIPEQTINQGVIRLKVTEGRLQRVRITGAHYFANGRIRDHLGEVSDGGEVLNIPELQAQLGSLNQQTRDRVITPVLKAGASPGTVALELKVQDSLPLHGSVELNDRYSANTTHTRASINLSYDNLFQRFHSLSLQYQGSPQKFGETQVLAATYLAPLDNGNLIAAYAVDTNSKFAVVSTGGDLSVQGTGTIDGLRYIVRLPTLAGYSQNITLGADYKDFSDNILQTDGTKDTTPIRYLGWIVGYGGNQQRDKSVTGFNINANFGLRGVVNDPAQFSYKRYEGKANYFYLRGDANHTQRLWGESSLYLKAAGQWSHDTLISNEQFATGGADGVRGYLESAQMADRGVMGTIELRSPSLHRLLGSWAQQWTTFAFYDTAYMIQISQRIENNQAFDVETGLASAGAGMRLTGFKGMEAALDWAYVLRQLNDDVAKGHSRFHFRVRYAF